jgi:hypothetical protein
MSERRDSERKSACGYFIVFNTENDQPLGRVVNLSEQGMMLVSDEPADAQSTFRCRMSLPEKLLDRRTITFEAKCRWCREHELTGSYQSGYVFTRIEDKDLEVLRLLTQNWKVEESGVQDGVVHPRSFEL